MARTQRDISTTRYSHASTSTRRADLLPSHHHQRLNQIFIWRWAVFPLPFRPFPSFSFSVSCFSSPPRSGPSKSANGYEGALLAPSLQRERTTFAATRHAPWTLKYTKKGICGRTPAANAFLVAQGTCMVAANVVLFLINEL